MRCAVSVILFNLHAAKDSLLKSFAYILRGNLDIHPHAAWGGQGDKDKGWGKGERMTLRSQTFMVQILRCLSSMSLRTAKLGFDPPVFVPSHRFLTQDLYTSLHSKLPWNGWAVHIKNFTLVACNISRFKKGDDTTTNHAPAIHHPIPACQCCHLPWPAIGE